MDTVTIEFQVVDIHTGCFNEELLLKALQYYGNHVRTCLQGLGGLGEDGANLRLTIAKGLDNSKDWLSDVPDVGYKYRPDIVQDAGSLIIVGMAGGEPYGRAVACLNMQLGLWAESTGPPPQFDGGTDSAPLRSTGPSGWLPMLRWDHVVLFLARR